MFSQIIYKFYFEKMTWKKKSNLAVCEKKLLVCIVQCTTGLTPLIYYLSLRKHHWFTIYHWGNTITAPLHYDLPMGKHHWQNLIIQLPFTHQTTTCISEHHWITIYHGWSNIRTPFKYHIPLGKHHWSNNYMYKWAPLNYNLPRMKQH